jgi:hypothetical protein
MANFFNNFLDSAFGADGYMKDFQHASKLYRSERFYDLAPKAGWLYYVRFNINTANEYVNNSLDKTWRERHLKRNTIGLLAKSVDMPRFTINSETVNQYNRRTIVQTKLTYSPLNITFHDDMANATTDFWKQYYGYYFADARAGRNFVAKGATNSQDFFDTKYSPLAYQYGLSNNQKTMVGFENIGSKFFNSIEIYQLNKKKYNSVVLVNPVIKDWSHGSLQQNSSNFLDNRMTVEYETVFYKNGNAKDTGFNDNFYDKNPSPNQMAGGLFGAGGVLNGAADVFGDISDINETTSPQDLFQIGLKTAALARAIPSAIQNAKQEGYSLLLGGLTGAAAATFQGGGNNNFSDYAQNYADQLSNDPNYSGIAARTGEAVNLYKRYSNDSVVPVNEAKQVGGPQ